LASNVSLAQTAPQLLPYTAKLIAGGGPVATYSAGGTCPVSGYPETDTYGDGCLANEIVLVSARYAIADSSGNIFFSDYTNGLVRRVDAVTGIVTAVAGGSLTTCGSNQSTDTLNDGCLGTAVKLSHPTGLAFDAKGDLFFADYGNDTVREIAATGGFVGGSVGSVAISSGGTGYKTIPTVTFSAPASGTTATGTATISAGGVVTGVTITNAGSGYTSTPTVTFSAPASGTTATGFVGTTGVITLVAGNVGGTYGYNVNNTAAGGSVNAATQSYLNYPYGIAFDTNGNLYIADEGNNAVEVVNLTSASETIQGLSVPAGTIAKVTGYGWLGAKTARSGDCPSFVSTTSASNRGGCYYAATFTGTTGVTANIDAAYSIALDGANNLYIANEYENNDAVVTPANNIYNFAGEAASDAKANVTTRAPAGSFAIGSNFGIAADASGNVYISDSVDGVIWRVDGPLNTNGSQSMYVVAGGVGDTGGPTTVCTGSDSVTVNGKPYSPGDGCPALQAILGSNGSSYSSTTAPAPGVWGVSVDAYSDLFFGDTETALIREIASGTQFGVVGANQPTDTVDIHFATSDTPSTTVAPYQLTSGASNFSLGTATCTTNSDKTTDCLLPVTATPTVLGPFGGTLKVTSALGSTANFALSGTYAQSPVTRTALSYTASSSCTGTTTYSTNTAITLTATLVANGPAPPVGTNDNITFYATNTATNAVTTLGTVAVSNLGTTASPVYGATLPYTFSTPGTYKLSATYSGDTYFKPSTGTDPTTITSSTPSFTVASTGYSGPTLNGVPTVAPGQTALFSLNIGLNVYSGTISFTVTGLPANSTYALTPNTIPATGCSTSASSPDVVALSIITQQGTTVRTAGFDSGGPGRWQVVCVLAGLGLALLIGLRRRRVAMRYGQIWMALALLIAATGTLACGKATGTVLQPATPAGSYTITVTPVSTVGTAPPAVQFPLIVN
jgi:hypothetical protein